MGQPKLEGESDALPNRVLQQSDDRRAIEKAAS